MGRRGDQTGPAEGVRDSSCALAVGAYLTYTVPYQARMVCQCWCNGMPVTNTTAGKVNWIQVHPPRMAPLSVPRHLRRLGGRELPLAWSCS